MERGRNRTFKEIGVIIGSEGLPLAFAIEKLQGAELGDEIFHGEAACGRICGNQAGLEQGSHAEGFQRPVRGMERLISIRLSAESQSTRAPLK